MALGSLVHISRVRVYDALFFESKYRIMQIVRGGKVLRLHDLLVIHWKTYAIVLQFETPCNKKRKELAGKPLRLEANPQKP